ncbi:hypothetical protein [Nitratireductor alexandrii]|uniref:MmyB family transcriptional regulator n=1 Tax=Nitratireductor alexandrii TaxID=2448161 RepID=UPI000FD83718|nr:hypothetical protein [Nitratireductor alexandrii]
MAFIGAGSGRVDEVVVMGDLSARLCMRWPSVDPLIRQLLDDLTARPAYVVNLRWDIIAWNRAAERLFDFSGRAQADRNFIRLVFADPEFRRRLPAWREDAPRLLAQFRHDLASAPDDPAMLLLIDEMKKVSPDFRRWIEKPGMERYGWGVSIVLDHKGGRLSFDHQMLTVDEHRHLRMIVYFEQ